MVEFGTKITRLVFFLAVFVSAVFELSSSTQADESSASSKSVSEAASVPTEIRYNRDVRPILADHCFACHGPDSASRKADLRLDKADIAEEFGAIVPGEIAASEVVKRIRLPDSDDLAMPPNTGHKRLDENQRLILERWIEQGAVYEPHWSFIAPSRPALPEVKDTQWAKNPIDRFILASIENRGLKPAEEADRRTLARRLSLDITGLPPGPVAVDAFVNDSSPEYYGNYVDSLLESDRWGEHRGRHWLDYARYGDTHGIHFDNYREMWSYRDWVIDAFNRNVPFDQFTIEQLAGDLLPTPTLEQKIATGFNRCNITTNEGGIIDEEYKVLYARDRTETTSTVWMALTTGCAVCHDHKFDPVSKKEFYSLSAFFNNTTQAVRDGNIADTPPIVPVPRDEDRQRFDQMASLIAAAKTEVETKRGDARKSFDGGLKKLDLQQIRDSVPSDGLKFHAMLTEGVGPAITSVIDGKLQLHLAAEPLQWAEGQTAPASLVLAEKSFVPIGDVAGDFEFDKPFSYGAWIYRTQDGTGGSVIARMDEANAHRGFDLWLENDRVGAHIISKYPENALKVVTKEPLPKNKWNHVFISYDGKKNVNGLQIFVNGVLRSDRNVSAKKITATIKNEVPLQLGRRSASSTPNGVQVNDVRLYDRELNAEEVNRLATGTRVSYLEQRPADKRTPAEADELFAYWVTHHSPEYSGALSSLAKLETEEKDIRSRGTIAHIMNERAEPAEAFILERGEYDQQREKVAAAVPEVLPAMEESLPRNRLGLAKWLVSHEHPLTARVTVNRFWQELFGTGLVATSGDFGVTGELPSHPELLDWLSVEFRENGWDVKQLIRMYVSSATYRQASVTTPEKLAKDPANRWLSRGPRFRLDAEMIRDYALSASDLLSATIGGPSVKPYQPEGVWEAVAMTPSNTRIYKQDSGEALYRRSMYTFWKRSAPPASMDIFNAPSREVCTVRRERTNTPLQALATLNDPQLVEAARNLAALAMRQSSENETRIDTIATRLLLRPLEKTEQEILARSLTSLLDHYLAENEEAGKLIAVGESEPPTDLPAGELAAYTMLANQLMNIDEVINK